MIPKKNENGINAGEMFLNERVLHSQRNEELARKVLDTDTFFAALPLNCRKIGMFFPPLFLHFVLTY